ncbi:MAG: hypothetical protein HZC40_23440 [Chloroflexi bacterium]|nr:hypothetical protein [Chloroflexota bacterium]
MNKLNFLLIALVAGIATACASNQISTIPTMTPSAYATIIAPSGYRPLQQNDPVEGTTIAYHYILPSLNAPAIVVAFGPNLIQLANVKPELVEGVAAFARELVKQPFTAYAFDENDPNQKEPKQLQFQAGKPVEIAFVALAPDRTWSVVEKSDNEIQAAYKIIRRKDGGLRFVDAYGQVAIFSASNTFTINGGGTGLMFSARLALLRAILSDPIYQRGENAVLLKPPTLDQYDPRVLKINPQASGLAQNQDWVIVTIPGPQPGRIAP